MSKMKAYMENRIEELANETGYDYCFLMDRWNEEVIEGDADFESFSRNYSKKGLFKLKSIIIHYITQKPGQSFPRHRRDEIRLFKFPNNRAIIKMAKKRIARMHPESANRIVDIKLIGQGG